MPKVSLCAGANDNLLGVSDSDVTIKWAVATIRSNFSVLHPGLYYVFS